MAVAVKNPEKYCPICGFLLTHTDEHRCSSRTLTALDGAREDGYAPNRTPRVGQRLQDGFQWSEIDEYADHELSRVCRVRDGDEILHWF